MSEELDRYINRTLTYHPPAEDKKPAFAEIRRVAREYATAIHEHCPPGRERALALTKLEEVVMWANAAIARDGH